MFYYEKMFYYPYSYPNRNLGEFPILPLDRHDEVKEFVDGLLNRKTISCVIAAKADENSIQVLGKKRYGDGFFDLCIELNFDKKSGSITKKSCFEACGSLFVFMPITGPLWLLDMPKRKKFNKKLEEIRESNIQDIKNRIKDIGIFQGSIAEVEKQIGAELEIISSKEKTWEKTEFMKEHDIFQLKAHACLAGADAIVHYQTGSALGTPVKIKK